MLNKAQSHQPGIISLVSTQATISVLAGLLLINAAPALTQNSNTTDNQAQEQAAPTMLEEIIVTAQKRAQNLQDVPVAVSVLSGKKIQDAGIQDLQELGPYVPNFFQANTTTSNLIFIRGIGSGDNPSFEQSVGIFHDGIYWGRGRQALSPLYDLDRIEVLKGPQSVLFGKNTVAGAVSSTSARPTAEYSGNLLLTTGSLDEQKVETVHSSAITDYINARLALHYQESDGWVKNKFTGSRDPSKETTGIRLGIDYELSESLQAYMKLEWNSYDLIGQPYEAIEINQKHLEIESLGSDITLPAQLSGLEDRLDGRSNWGNNDMPSRKGAVFDTDFINHLIQLDWDIQDYTLTAITAYSAYRFYGAGDLDISPQDFLGVDNREDYKQFSQELRLQSPIDGPFNYIAGVYLQQGKMNWDTSVHMRISTILEGVLSDLSINGLPGFIPGIRDTEGIRSTDYDLTTDSASIFFQGTYSLNDQLRLTLGARYTHEKKEVEKDIWISTFGGLTISADDAQAFAANPDYETNALSNGFLQMALSQVWEANLDVFPYYIEDERSENSFTPLVIIEWDFDEDTLFYGSATTGFKAGGFDTNHANGATQKLLDEIEFEEEKVLAFELGAKMILMDNRLNLNAALYRTSFDDLQVSIFNGTSAFYVTNAGDATSQGLELEGRFMATANIAINASIAWTHFKYGTYREGQCTTKDQAAWLLKDSDYSDCQQDLSGKDAPFSPDKIASVSLTHFTYLKSRLQLVSTLDINYSDKYFLNADLDPVTLQDDYAKVNARLSLIHDSGWQLALIVKNLTDKKTISIAEDIPFGNGNAFASTICQDPTTSGSICNNARDQLADEKGSFYSITDPPRRYIVEARYRF